MIIEASMKVTPKNANVRQQSLISFPSPLFIYFYLLYLLFFFLFFFLFCFVLFYLFFLFLFLSLSIYIYIFFFSTLATTSRPPPTLVLKSFPKQFQSSFIFNGKVNSWFSTLACNELVEQELVKISSRGSTKDIMQGWLFG